MKDKQNKLYKVHVDGKDVFDLQCWKTYDKQHKTPCMEGFERSYTRCDGCYSSQKKVNLAIQYNIILRIKTKYV